MAWANLFARALPERSKVPCGQAALAYATRGSRCSIHSGESHYLCNAVRWCARAAGRQLDERGSRRPHCSSFSKITTLAAMAVSQRMPTRSYPSLMARCNIGLCWFRHSKRIMV